MLLTPHMAAGVAIGSAVSNPALAIPLAFLSHFALDAVPHWDDVGMGRVEDRYSRISKKTFRSILLDFLIGSSLVLSFMYLSLPDIGVAVTIAFCAVASVLPDIYYIPVVFFEKRWDFLLWMARMQGKIQNGSSKTPKRFGLLTQGILIALCLLIAHQQILVLLPQVWKIP